MASFKTAPERVRVIKALERVSMYVNKELASGGHQLYAPFGGLYGQSFPGREALYGPINEQLAVKTHAVKPSVPVTACVKQPPSMFTAAPSYAYNGDQDKSWYLGGGKPPLPPPVADSVLTGPPVTLGEKRMDFAASQPSYPIKDPCLSINQSAPDPVGFRAIHELKLTDCC
ncbi:unnamed protein product [Echinostoma caproni]|uniref:Uncharacterized protein n=1 Tax=Echinostoma caproni TaxID=27848 RepID=A0A3P8G9J1_9TREM|nr:unnamed protein product [Echinostoma caproni]